MPCKKPPSKISPKITLQEPKDLYNEWFKEIEATMKLGYPYDIAYALVSKRKIQELFDNDGKVNPS